MAVQAECAAFLRGVAAGFASAVAVPHRGVRTAARGRAEVRFFDGETAARRELADAERFIMGDAAIWFCDERGASGDGEKSMACRACDYDICIVCVTDTVENDDDDDAHTAAHDHDAYVRPEPSCPPERRHGARLRTAAQHAF